MFRKLLLATLAGLGGYFAYKKRSQQTKADQSMWADEVDAV